MTDSAAPQTRIPASIALWPPSRGHLKAFLKTPLAWVMLTALVGFASMDASVRAETRVVCGAVSVMLDRQLFTGEYDGVSRTKARFMRACEGFAQPDSLDLRGGLVGADWFEPE
ncbi:MAG: hypothetical protein HOB82_00855 [Alphaproteobacteria bacterium]|jgi:hypothetical protein|nr:hypothetical protein [Alphaproteobacteria bacterium]MBT4710064.1 hypothetical protein [Alphaproteobacteria bacterium]MBT5860746.1 hypothetical protein [Alphaproteobacteria bacterium]